MNTGRSRLAVSRLVAAGFGLAACGLPLAANETPMTPMLCVGRADAAPVIDGKIEDPAWQDAIAISDFIAPDSCRPLQEETQVRLLWDTRCLYLFARLEESILATTSQKQHELRAGATRRDGKVVEDDCFVLILHPQQSDRAFEFAVNSNGILADAKSDPADPWGTRELSWNADVKLATFSGNGFWTVEMAIPWSELGIAAPAPGTRWKAVLARHAAARRESGAWNPSHHGIHAPAPWGMLVFGAPAVGLRATPPRELQAGKNRLELTAMPHAGGKGNILVSSRISADRGRPVQRRQAVPLDGPGPIPIAHEFEVPPSDGAVRFSWSVQDAATLETLYHSPDLAIQTRVSGVMLRLSTPAAWRLQVNGEEIASGSGARGESIRVALRPGVNLLALEARGGTARLGLESSGLGDAPIAWKTRAAEDPSALDPRADDSQWATAPVDAMGEVGKSGTPAVFRHTILLQQTRIFPLPEPALHLAGGGVQPVTFTAFGIPEKPLRNWKMWLELPQQVEALLATGYYGSRGSKPRFSLHPEENHRYLIEADLPVTGRKAGGNPILSLFDVALRRAPASAEPDATCLMRHYSRANDNTVSELAQETPLRLLPPLRGVQPKRLTWQLWASYFSNLDDPRMREALAETARAAGFNDLVGASREQAGPHSLHGTLLANFKPSSLNLAPWLIQHPEARLIHRDGQPDGTLLCTTALLEDGWKKAGAPLLKKWWESSPVDTVDYDYEYSPFTGPHSCYCPRCLEAFREAIGLKPGAAIDPAVIEERYGAQWIDFMARRVAKLFRLMKETVHELPGDVKFEVYSGYPSPQNVARYGVDWRHVGELQAVDRAGMGYGRPLPGIYDSVTALCGIPVMFGELISPYMKEPLDFSRPARQVTKAALLRRFIDATGGALIYHTQNMDGRSWYAAAETSRLVAAFEDRFGTGQAEAVPGQPESDATLLGKEGGALLCLMNPGRSEKKVVLDLPKGWPGAKEFYSGQTVPPGERIRIVLPAGEAAAYFPNP